MGNGMILPIWEFKCPKSMKLAFQALPETLNSPKLILIQAKPTCP